MAGAHAQDCIVTSSCRILHGRGLRNQLHLHLQAGSFLHGCALALHLQASPHPHPHQTCSCRDVEPATSTTCPSISRSPPSPTPCLPILTRHALLLLDIRRSPSLKSAFAHPLQAATTQPHTLTLCTPPPSLASASANVNAATPSSRRSCTWNLRSTAP